jgi:hypothetical protein
MHLQTEKERLKGDSSRSARYVEVRKTSGATAIIRFYAVHNAGEQLRQGGLVRTGTKLDRLVGR